MTVKYSVVVPVYNEVENLDLLFDRVLSVMDDQEESYELLAVDDGSTDGSRERIKQAGREQENVRPVLLDGNYGLSTALKAGFDTARGTYVISLDADLQNPPEEIPKLLAHSDDYDLVYGRRQERKDGPIKKLTSTVANAVRNVITGDDVSDTGCTLKVYRREALQQIPFFKGMHRFLPTLFRYYGFSRKEVPVRHEERHGGTSKYQLLNRAVTLFDLCACVWMRFRRIRYKLEEQPGQDGGSE
jgi:glycosyltransferase involved in cell wall biosynthesis